MEKKEKTEEKLNVFSKLLKTAKGKVIFAVLLVVLIAIIGLVLEAKVFNKEEEASFDHLNLLLQKSSELTTAKLKIRGIENYKDAGAMIINRSDFIMVYSATVKAGINLKEVQIKPNKATKQVVAVMPEAKIFESHVDQNEIQYFDEKFALFNLDSKEDANKACALAEQDAIREAAATGILSFAETTAKEVIKGLLTPALPEGYTLVIEIAK